MFLKEGYYLQLSKITQKRPEIENIPKKIINLKILIEDYEFKRQHNRLDNEFKNALLNELTNISQQIKQL